MRYRRDSNRFGLWAALLGLLILCALPARAGAVALDPVDTFTSPIHVTAPPGDPRLFVVERGGVIKVKNGAAAPTNFLDITGFVTSDPATERGLLSMAFDPNYASNGLFYVFYNSDGGDPPGGALGDIVIDEYKVSGGDPNDADEGSRRRVMLIPRGTGATNHNGGQIQFGNDAFLYISIGDAADSARAQNLMSLHGKILRIDPHGAGPDQYTVPPSNPFFGSLSAANEIWSSGLRNPYRFSIDHADGALLIGDVGAGSFEEVDYRPPSVGGGHGDNFGWPTCEGFSGPPSCTTTFAAPIFDYANDAATCAIIGGFVYRGSDIPELAGRYLYADLCDADVRSLVPSIPFASGERLEVPIGASPVSFGEDSRCELYVAAGSQVLKVVSSPGALPGSGGCVTPPPPGASPVSPVSTPSAPSAARKKKCKKGKKRKRRKCRKKRKRKK